MTLTATATLEPVSSSAGDDPVATIAGVGLLRTIPLREIVPSLTNRTTFDEAKINELAASIASSGVHTPILVRPLPASRLEETFDTDSRPGFEIVYGERRYRASALAGKTSIPAIVRPMTDSEAVEAQLIENVQREGLHPLEEAEGYERLMQFGESGTGERPTALEIGVKVGRSKAYVYAKLKLLALCKPARDAFAAGKVDESKALLIARIPGERRQLEALKALTTPDWQGETMSYRDAARYVQREHMLKLGTAKFKITDASLLPEAGDCRSCAKRVGADRELYPDVDGADVCTDRDCFDRKTDAHAAALRARAVESGQQVIEGAEAKKLRPQPYGGIPGYVRVDEIGDSPSDKPIRKLLGADMPAPAVFIDPHDQSVLEVLPREVVGKLLKDKGLVKTSNDLPGRGAEREESAAAVKARTEEKFQLAWRAGACEAIYLAAIEQKRKTLPEAALRLLAAFLMHGVNADDVKRIALVLDPKNSAVAPRGAVDDFIRECPESKLPALVMLLLAEHDVSWNPYMSEGRKPARIEALAEDLEVDLESVRALVKTDMQQTEAERKARKAAREAKEAAKAGGKPAAKGQAAPAPAAAPAAPARPARAPKATATEARAKIAEAMQQAESSKDTTGDLLANAGVDGAFAINQFVRVDPKGLRGELEQWAGRKGQVRAVNNGLVDVRFKGRNAGLVTFPSKQLNPINEEA